MASRITVLLLTILATCALASHHGDHGGDDIDMITERLDDATARLHDIESPVENRLDPKWKRKAHSMAARILHIEEEHLGSVCEEHEHRCGQFDLQCVHNLFVCDGVKDCRNGEDEDHCDAPIHVGDTFIGTAIYDHCGYAHPKDQKVKMVINKVKSFPYFTSHLGLQVTTYLNFDYHGRETNYAFPSKGYYNFATHSLVVLPPSTRSLGLHCEFDGYDFSSCHGKVMLEGSLHVCAEYHYEKQH
jgi:hypothetical protein